MRFKKKSKYVTVTLYLQICRNGYFWSKRKWFSVNENCFQMETVVGMQWNSSHRPQIHKKSRTRNPFKVSATPVPYLDQNQKRLFIKDLIPCSSTQGTPKRPNTFKNRFTQIDHRSTHRCFDMVKTLERETVHNPSQIDTWSNLLCKRKKVTNELIIIDQLAKDYPCSLNRDHGPIGCYTMDQG